MVPGLPSPSRFSRPIAPSLSQNVNDGRTFGTNAPILRVTSSAASTGQTGGLALGLPTLISTTDGAVSLEAVYCLGNCALGPSVEVGGRLYGRMDADRLDALLSADR